MSAPDLPIFSRDAIREVDRAAIEEYGIPGIVLMENAARGLAEHAAAMVSDVTARPPRIGIVCGSGNNGGDGYALARHLYNRGMEVAIVAIGEPKPDSDAGMNAAICRKMGLAVGRAGVSPAEDSDSYKTMLASSDLLIDAIFGTGLTREVAPPHRDAIEWMNGSGIPILAVDCPSGLDCETGSPLGVAIKATRTVTFVGWKTGFTRYHAKPYLGQIHVVTIGAPRELVDRLRRPGP